jgi:hypothetical protein
MTENEILTGKLEAEKYKLSERLKKDLIPSIEKLVTHCGGYTQISERDYSTHGCWDYEDGEFKIRYEFGIYAMGDGKRYDVDFNNKKVLEIRECLKNDSQPNIKLEESTFVVLYNPGDWERRIRCKNLPIKEGLFKAYKESFPSIR